MNEMVGALKQAFEKRLSSPIFGSLVFGFIGTNHKGIALFLAGNIDDRKIILTNYNMMNELNDILLYAGSLYVMLNIIFPLVQNIVDWGIAHSIHQIKCNADKKRRTSEIWSEREAIESGISKKIESWEKEKLEIQSELKRLEDENSTLKGKLQTEDIMERIVNSANSSYSAIIREIDIKAQESISDITESTKQQYNEDLGNFKILLMDMKAVINKDASPVYAEINER